MEARERELEAAAEQLGARQADLQVRAAAGDMPFAQGTAKGVVKEGRDRSGLDCVYRITTKCSSTTNPLTYSSYTAPAAWCRVLCRRRPRWWRAQSSAPTPSSQGRTSALTAWPPGPSPPSPALSWTSPLGLVCRPCPRPPPPWGHSSNPPQWPEPQQRCLRLRHCSSSSGAGAVTGIRGSTNIWIWHRMCYGGQCRRQPVAPDLGPGAGLVWLRSTPTPAAPRCPSGPRPVPPSEDRRVGRLEGGGLVAGEGAQGPPRARQVTRCRTLPPAMAARSGSNSSGSSGRAGPQKTTTMTLLPQR